MITTSRGRLVSGFAILLALALTAACSTATVQPAASPETGDAVAAPTAAQEECARNGGVWRLGLDIWGGGMCEFPGTGDATGGF